MCNLFRSDPETGHSVVHVRSATLCHKATWPLRTEADAQGFDGAAVTRRAIACLCATDVGYRLVSQFEFDCSRAKVDAQQWRRFRTETLPKHGSGGARAISACIRLEVRPGVLSGR